MVNLFSKYRDVLPDGRMGGRTGHASVADGGWRATMLDEEAQFHEEIAAGILYLRRHYPTMYRLFETAWNELYESHAGHLNRETRRSLR